MPSSAHCCTPPFHRDSGRAGGMFSKHLLVLHSLSTMAPRELEVEQPSGKRSCFCSRCGLSRGELSPGGSPTSAPFRRCSWKSFPRVLLSEWKHSHVEFGAPGSVPHSHRGHRVGCSPERHRPIWHSPHQLPKQESQPNLHLETFTLFPVKK